ncbi:MAG: NUDIX hydrolase [Pseudomonadota bacterium]
MSKNPPVRPKDAASLVIHRREKGVFKVLMGRRGSKARFQPGVYVFPGGVLEGADYRAWPAKPLNKGQTSLMAVANSDSKARALAMAAVREAYEEAGLMCGIEGQLGDVRHPTWEIFRALGQAPDLSALKFIGRAITPAQQPMRFHARFFAVAEEQLAGEIKGDGELEDLQWIKIDQTADLKLMVVQQMILKTLHEELLGEAPKPQFLRVRGGKILIGDA